MPSDDPISQAEIDGLAAAFDTLTADLDPHAVEANRLLRARRNVVLYGPPGTGKTRAALQVAELWRAENGNDSVVLTTFHPSYNYEDFVEGWRPEPGAEGGFDLKPGVFLDAIKSAVDNDPRPVLLLIDEINRGDVARIFGELITYIEHDKRGIEFTSAQDRRVKKSVPSNLYLLGTMNTADKSISLLDVALRRRFAFIPCPPEPAILATTPDWLPVVDGIELDKLLVELNSRLARHDIEVDRQIGHALLGIPASTDDPIRDLLDRLYYDVLPLVEEYLYADREAIREVLPGFLNEGGSPVRPDSLTTVKALFETAVSAALAPTGNSGNADTPVDEVGE
ncbi:AAA family ATPase [Cyanobium sp. N.Huapi 1H5]|uniref:McrB family protein n=1 Tax=Cyanobium sp. N.Huapi 1H5 TaxID=2823719 RepID=UPI0020CE767A|nr:AAA family ATPase [Cyanobium sp. N.Huapi 1H5]MCP9837278.1 AAA family ATPase [Cyanobium sp. N.Huapi 1H5]